jgi:GDP-L-fucose synthase
LADAVVFLMKSWSDEEPINIGTGTDVTIGKLVELIAEIAGFKGRFVCDVSKPDGTPRKLLDIAKLTALGWCPRISLEAGIRQTYEWYRTSRAAGIGVRLGAPRAQPDVPHLPGYAQTGS